MQLPALIRGLQNDKPVMVQTERVPIVIEAAVCNPTSATKFLPGYRYDGQTTDCAASLMVTTTCYNGSTGMPRQIWSVSTFEAVHCTKLNASNL